MKTETLPTLTHAQFYVLTLLEQKPVDGPDLHKKLAGVQFSTTKEAFYQMMGRLETADLVKGEYVQRQIESALSDKPRAYRFRVYSITAKGRKEREAALSFYATAA